MQQGHSEQPLDVDLDARARARSASNIAITATPNECAATDSTSRTPRNNHPIRGVDFSRINSARKVIKPPASGKCTSLFETHGIEHKSNRASRLFSIQATLTVLARRVNRVLYLAFIIRGLMSVQGTPAGAKSLLMRYPISFKIEGRELSPPLILSPMAGGPIRLFAGSKKCGGLGLIVTEFISVEGLTRQFAIARDDALQA